MAARQAALRPECHPPSDQLHGPTPARHHRVDETITHHLGRRHRSTGHHQADRDVVRDQSLQHHHATVERQPPYLGLGKRERRVSAAITMSHPITISSPPPSAKPLIRAMTGILRVLRIAIRPKPTLTEGFPVVHPDSARCHPSGPPRLKKLCHRCQSEQHNGPRCGLDLIPDFFQSGLSRVIDCIHACGAINGNTRNAPAYVKQNTHTSTSPLSAVKPNSRRISSVCSPRRGGVWRTETGASLRCTGDPISVSLPKIG